MFSYEEKKHLLALLKKQRRKSFFKKTPEVNQKLIDKLEQMIRNEEVNKKELRTKF